jgi:hypothetical protein
MGEKAGKPEIPGRESFRLHPDDMDAGFLANRICAAVLS